MASRKPDTVMIPDARDFGVHAALGQSRRLRGGMPAKCAQEAVYAFHAAELHEADEKVVVERELKRGIDAAGLIVDAPAPEAGLLRDVVPALHHPVAMLRENPVRLHIVGFVDKSSMAVNRVHVWMFDKKTSDEIESAGCENIVAV